MAEKSKKAPLVEVREVETAENMGIKDYDPENISSKVSAKLYDASVTIYPKPKSTITIQHPNDDIDRSIVFDVFENILSLQKYRTEELNYIESTQAIPYHANINK